jgi:arsenate reductase
VEGPEEQKRRAFEDAYRVLDHRVSLFVSLPVRSLERLALQERVTEIGRS